MKRTTVRVLLTVAIAASAADGRAATWISGGGRQDCPTGQGRADGPSGNNSAWITKALAWPGGPRLGVSIPADVHYTQGPATSLTVSGPDDMVRHVIVDGDVLRFDTCIVTHGRLRVVMTSPDIRSFSMSGDQHVTIKDYRADAIDIVLAGSQVLVADGAAGSIALQISGSGSADLGRLAGRRAAVHLSGSGSAIVAPTREADLSIAGSGNIRLDSQPADVTSSIAGSGAITRGSPGGS